MPVNGCSDKDSDEVSDKVDLRDQQKLQAPGCSVDAVLLSPSSPDQLTLVWQGQKREHCRVKPQTLAWPAWTSVSMLCALFCATAGAAETWMIKAGFIVDNPPFRSSHASTIVETDGDLLAAWFGGTQERAKDVSIYQARYRAGRWSDPVEVANGIQPDGKRWPCWNPVLFRPAKGPLLLFYKVGPNPSEWWGMLRTSQDNGQSWSEPSRLPAGIIGPVRNKPVELASGLLLCGSSTEEKGWRVHMEWTKDLGRTWERTPDLNRDAKVGVIQPTILVHSPDSIQILCRSQEKKIFESWSSDEGKTWSPLAATPLPNPNSAIDAVRLRKGGVVLVYNHTPENRSPLNLGLSHDGKSWLTWVALETEPGEYSYPAIIQSADGLLHITYTWKRQRIKHVVADPVNLFRLLRPAAR